MLLSRRGVWAPESAPTLKKPVPAIPATLVTVAVALAAAAGGYALRGQLSPREAPQRAEAARARSAAADDRRLAAGLPPEHPTAFVVPPHIRWIAAGGGGDPAYNEVSLEQDLALAREVLGPRGGLVLHGGGFGVDGVRVRDDRSAQFTPAPPDSAAVIALLAELFDPVDREVRFRPSRLEGAGPATYEVMADALAAALASTSGDDAEPLLFFFSGHGEQGAEPRENTVHTWGGWGISPADIAGILEEATRPRPAVFVVAACFSGGFGDLAFAGADAATGEAAAGRCGVFASTWDRESAGCDPDPDRGAQGGYSMHFLNALRGRDAGGVPLPLASVDYDGDGRISVLEAHTRARIASTSIDVPTTTSEVWLRRSFAEAGERAASGLPVSFAPAPTGLTLPEEAAAIDALGSRFGLRSAEAVAAHLEVVEGSLDTVAARLDILDEDYGDAWARARIALLERWPVLGDPYHRDYAPTLREEGAEIRLFFDEAPEVSAWALARQRLEAEGDTLELEAEYAALLRLERAWQTRDLAQRLATSGGDEYRAYEALLACERTVFAAP